MTSIRCGRCGRQLTTTDPTDRRAVRTRCRGCGLRALTTRQRLEDAIRRNVTDTVYIGGAKGI